MPLPIPTTRCPTTIARLGATLLGVVACNLVDDEPDDPLEPGTAGSAGAEECIELAQEVASSCMPPQQFVALWDEGNSSMILIDDPSASVEVGPGGWLVQVNSAADYVGTYQFQGDTCTVGCGWCQPGQSVCYTGFDQNGWPLCMMCVEAGTPDPGAQCALHVAACNDANADDTSDEGGLDDTGSDGAGVVGHQGVMSDSEEMLAYDCAQWDPSAAVSLDVRGNATIDAAIIEEIAVHFGDPLVDCDDTRFWQRPDGYFAVKTTSPSGLLAAMGLQPGDAILAVDGVSMEDAETIAATAIDMFLGSQLTSGFSLTVGRGRERIAMMVLVR